MHKLIIKLYLLIVLLDAVSTTSAFGQNSKLGILFSKPAERWEETLPLGNGRLGMMPDGGVDHENVVLNDITLWSGGPQDANNYHAHEYLPAIRKLLTEGKNDEAQAIMDKNFICTGEGSAGTAYGCYQVLGNLEIDYKYPDTDGGASTVKNYRRRLALNNAIATSTYELNGVNYTREYFTSFSGDLAIIRIMADKPGQVNFNVKINRPERAVNSVINGELQLMGQLDNGTDGNGMKFMANVKVLTEGGSVQSGKGELNISQATVATIYISAGTDFENQDFEAKTAQLLSAALKVPYLQEKRAHSAAYQRLFNRLSLQIGSPTSNDQIETDKRLLNFRKDPAADPELPVLFFQFGRYLSISSTRVGLLPPNLQGLWANQIKTPWNGDYHLDVNIQMNQWPVEVTNLSEFNLPLAELVKGMVPSGEKTAKAYYNAEGWVAHVITNVWGFTEPGESASWGVTKSGSGWLCNNLWEHYAFTEDKTYLKDIYPVLKGSAEFYNSMLVVDPKTGWLVTSPSSSPENSFYLTNGKHASISMGPTIDNQIIRELFTNVIEASKILNVDPDFSAKLKQAIKKLPPVGQIGKDGRLMEWLTDYKETEPQHRHVSHLYGLFPASLISPTSTPELAEASKKTLNVRGDDGPSWSIAYKILWWARLQDGNRAYKLLTELLKPTIKTDINYGAGGGVYPNLLSAGPPFQIDGNFGATAGIAEMLVQSHEGFINLLPAIPDEWKSSGAVRGLKSRGNLTINFAWKDGKVTSYKITGPVVKKVKLKINGEIRDVSTEKA